MFQSRKNKNHSDSKNLGLLQLYSSVIARLIISGITIYCCTMLENKHFVVLLTAQTENSGLSSAFPPRAQLIMEEYNMYFPLLQTINAGEYIVPSVSFWGKMKLKAAFHLSGCCIWRAIMSQWCDEGCPISKAPSKAACNCSLLLLHSSIHQLLPCRPQPRIHSRPKSCTWPLETTRQRFLGNNKVH